jgi:hypothetical protein
MWGWILAFVYLLILSAVQRWYDGNFPRTWRYDPVRKWRTSRVKLFMKAWLLLIPPSLIVMLMIGGTILNAVTGAFFGMLAFTAFMEIGLRLCMGWWHSDNSSYTALLKDGYDPFFDNFLMGIVNRDPEEARAGQPPLALRGSNWQAPSNWIDRCPSCGAAQPGPIFWCWRCGRGFEHGCQKMCCPDCDTTFCESEPGISRQMPVRCPGCGRAWRFPSLCLR